MSAVPAPGYWILTATSRPSRHVARCTWPMLAAAAGWSSKSENRWRQVPPSCWESTACTVRTGIGGASSCSFTSASRYGAAISSGTAASKTDSVWPSFIAPPLS